MPSSILKRARASTFALAVLAVVPGAPAPHFPPPAGTIRGVVRDQAGAPIANAQVVVVGTAFSSLTDPKGAYEMTNVPVGTFSVRAGFIGYKSRQVDGVRVRAGATTVVDIALEQTAVQVDEITVTPEADKVRRERSNAPAFEEARVVTGMSGRTFGNAQSGQPMVGVHGFPEHNTEEYGRIYDNRFLAAASNPLSTFGVDVDGASYANVRRFLTSGQLPPADAVRIEEMINYFTYDYPDPPRSQPFSVSTDMGEAPWNPEHRLVRIGLQGKRIATRDLPPSNLVFLIDVSGSMQSPDKLPLVKQAFRLLVRQLREEDRVAIVVYAGAAGLVLPPTPGDDKHTILQAIERLEAGGSTAGGAGIQLAYQVARQSYRKGGNNRVVLATDGDFNVGTSSTSELVRLVEEKRQEGTALTVLGFGTGNLKDTRMEQLADKGNGNYAYIDDLPEARKVFVQELGGTLVTIARDVKIQVEFNPARVASYRLIGYENRLLAKEDFDDDTKDAGELGAGHRVTALYEIVPVGAEELAEAGDSLRYQTVSVRPEAMHSAEWLTVKLRYQPPRGGSSKLLSHAVRDSRRRRGPDDDFRFAAAVAAFGMILRGSEHRGAATLDGVLELARGSIGEDVEGYRAEFVRLVETARRLQGAEPLD